MSKVFLFFLAVLIAFFSIQSCVHNPSDIIPTPIDTTGTDTSGKRPCNPDTVYYARDIQPIFSQNCVGSGCHNPPNPEDGLDLTSFQTAIQSDKIKPFNGSNSELYEVLSKSGTDRMPPLPAAGLTSEQKALIKKWIDQGAKNLWCDDMMGPCDTANVTYSATISKILTNNCVGCHSTAGGVVLTNYSGVKAVIDDGRLWNGVNHLSGVQKAMPPGNKLSACNLRQIKIWIDAGAPQN